MKKIRKTYSGVVPNGKVLNGENSSLQDTYSCDYLNKNIPRTNNLGDIVVDSITCKNLLVSSAINSTKSGISLVVNEDGTCTISGTATEAATFNLGGGWEDFTLDADNYVLSIGENPLPDGVYINTYHSAATLLTQIAPGNRQRTFTVNSKTTFTSFRVDVYIGAGTTVDITLKPMIERGTIYSNFTKHKEFTNAERFNLWKNSDTTVNMGYQASIALKTDDYDEYEVFCYLSTTNTHMISSGRIPAGVGTSLSNVSGFKGNVFSRTFDYKNKKSFSVSACYTYGKDYPTPPREVNDQLIPAYIIGYKY